jgi:hypothetical protein
MARVRWQPSIRPKRPLPCPSQTPAGSHATGPWLGRHSRSRRGARADGVGRDTHTRLQIKHPVLSWPLLSPDPLGAGDTQPEPADHRGPDALASPGARLRRTVLAARHLVRRARPRRALRREKRTRHRPDGRPLLPARPVACEGVIP